MSVYFINESTKDEVNLAYRNSGLADDFFNLLSRDHDWRCKTNITRLFSKKDEGTVTVSKKVAGAIRQTAKKFSEDLPPVQGDACYLDERDMLKKQLVDFFSKVRKGHHIYYSW